MCHKSVGSLKIYRFCQTVNNLSRDVRKSIFKYVRHAKMQIILRNRAVWSESSLGTFWIAKNAEFLLADNEDLDQTARMSMRSLIRVFVVGRTCEKVCFLMLRLLWCLLKFEVKIRYICCLTTETLDWLQSPMTKYVFIQSCLIIHQNITKIILWL